MNTIADTLASDFPGTKMIIGQIAHNDASSACVDAVRLAQSNLPLNNSNTLPGSITYDIKLSDEGGDTLHFKSDGDLSVFAQRWWNAISKNIYGNTINTPPVVDTANIAYNRTANTVDIPFQSDLATSTAQSFTNNLAGATLLPSSSAFTLATTGGTPTISSVSLLPDNRTIRLTLSGAVATTLSVSYASGNTAVNNALYSTVTGQAAIPFYAQSAADQYVITYDANTATSGTAPTSQTKTHDISRTLASNSDLVKTNYSFVGWNTQADGNGTEYAAGASYTANASVTLYAEWTTNRYTLSFDSV